MMQRQRMNMSWEEGRLGAPAGTNDQWPQHRIPNRLGFTWAVVGGEIGIEARARHGEKAGSSDA